MRRKAVHVASFFSKTYSLSNSACLMLLVKTKIGPSNIHGIGLFADQFIPKGTVVWKYYPEFDKAFKREDLNFLPKEVAERVIDYCYRSGDTYVMCFDNARFFNHSDNPSTIDEPGVDTGVIAARDLNIGDEITSDYRVFDDDHPIKLG